MGMPESQLIEGELILRDMQLSRDVRLTKASLTRWLALAMGLISPNESRTTMLDLFDALITLQFEKRADPDMREIMEEMDDGGKEKATEKAVRYHLLRLKNLGLIDRRKGRYFFTVSPLSEKYDLPATIDYALKRRSDTAISKMKDAARELQESFARRRQQPVEVVQFIKKKPST